MTSVESWKTWEPGAKLRLLARLRAERWARLAHEAQREPDGDWRVWYLRGGRGAGKTRTGSETLAGWILDAPDPGDWAVVAPTFGAARDVCVEGPSGLLRALGSAVTNWNRSNGQLFVAGGSRVYLDGADDGALRIQGENLHGCWCDEVGLWSHGWKRAWEESIRFAVRLAPGRIVATGTPKAGHPLVRMLLEDSHTRVSLLRTVDNADNLDPGALDELLRLYSGTRLGRQELDAEFLEDVEGALWSRDQIENLRVAAMTPDEVAKKMRRVLVGVDPQGSSEEAANKAGIIVVGLGHADKKGYVLADRTPTRNGPHVWGQAVVDAYHEFNADRVVAETNFGGEMVSFTIRAVDASVPVKLIRASRGKRVRAEPIATLYEGDEPKVHHAGVFPELEDEMCHWTPEAESPDRMDALVWALTELGVWTPPGHSSTHVPRARLPGF